MKTNIKTVALVFLVTFVKKSNAQGSLDLFLVGPKHSNIAKNAIGVGFNFFSSPLKIGNKRHPDFEIRAGGGLYTSSLMKHKITDVPLAAPQIGSSWVSVENHIYGCNAMARFSAPYSKKVIPYVDVFGGLLEVSCRVEVNPYKSNSQQYYSTSQSVANISEYNYGVSGGIMFYLASDMKLDLGLTMLYSRPCGQMVDIPSSHVESNSVVLYKIDPPTKMVMFKVGLVFIFNKSSSKSYGAARSGGYHSRGGGFSSFLFGGGHSGGLVNVIFKSTK